ncbi:MAG: dihydropteroate synthase [Gemmatimonadaceae bacterium]
MLSAPLFSLLAPHGAPRRTLVMGILNVTPDSFSDGGLYADPARAVEHALALVHEGADLIDIGGESTRPGHAPVPLDEELRRVCPVLERLAAECPVPISIDTTKSEVARRAVMLGARIINDQHGLQGDPAMAAVAAACGVPVIAMHDRQVAPGDDVMFQVIAFLRRSLDVADASGLGRDRVIVDPGFGFGKSPAQNLEVLRRLAELQALGRPILIGTSRKSMIAHVLPGTLPSERVEGTAATVAIGIAFGADIVRVHDVRAMVRVARMADAVMRPSPSDATPQGAAAAATP